MIALQIANNLGISFVDGANYSEQEIYAKYPDNVLWKEKAGERKVKDSGFAKLFRDINMLKFFKGVFYTKDGIRDPEWIEHEIWETLDQCDLLGCGNSSRLVVNLRKACAYESTVLRVEPDENIIPFANGNFYIDEWVFRVDEITTVPYRLPVNLTNFDVDTPYFDKWLSDLFEPDDIITLQEYLGYCLVPTTASQKALFLVGEGGAGKSGLGVILESLLGDFMVSVSNTNEFLENRFMQSELEYKLVLYDDDLGNTALGDTGKYKQLITNKLPLTSDKKYGPIHKFKPHVKLIACCNEMLISLHDKTEGFYRRLLPLIVKSIQENFTPDPTFYDHFKDEAEGIVLWALCGLKRLIENKWDLHESQRTIDFLKKKKEMENPLDQFMVDRFILDESAPGYPTRKILTEYHLWCTRNAVDPLSDRTVQKWLSSHSEDYNIEHSNHVLGDDGIEARGYKGLILRNQTKPTSSTIEKTSEGNYKIQLM